MLKCKEKIIFFFLIGCLLIPGCKKEAEETKKETGETPPVEINTDEEKDETEKEEKQETTAEKVSVIVYYPDEMGEEVLTESVECDELTEDTLWGLLKKKEIITDECEINSFRQNEMGLELDVNEGFGNRLRSMGSTGEKMILHCVVNTFLDAYQSKQIKITENENVLCSGHSEYEDYFTKFK